MATCRDIITRALRKIGEVSEGQPAANAYAATNALATLQAWYEDGFNGGMFGRFSEVIATEDYEAGEFERIRKDAAITVTIPDAITDDETGEERPPVDLCPIAVVEDGADPQYSLYDAIAGAWVRLDGLTLDSDAPLSTRGADGLACVLAALIADEFGGKVGQITVSRATHFRMALVSRHAAARRVVEYEFY
jgi:hypothetical protein